jgi:hypothetical protein
MALYLSTNDFDDPQQNDRADQCDQHGRKGDGIIDRPNTQERADEITSKERADNTDYDIEQCPLLRIRVHDPTSDKTNDRSSNEVYDEIHFLLLYKYFKFTVSRVGLLIRVLIDASLFDHGRG